MSEAMALLRQIQSDRRAAVRVYDAADPATYCQSVAKCQQVAEKCVKAVAAALNETGRVSIARGYTHDPNRLLSALLRVARTAKVPALRGVLFHLNRVFGGRWWSEIRDVCALAPTRPARGQPHQKNTEYPYQNPDGTWRAPADPGSFSRDHDVERYQRLAEEQYPDVARLVSGILRIPV